MCTSGVIPDEGLMPIALLHREHEVILIRLALLEKAVRGLRGNKLIASQHSYRINREAVEEQVKFFTKAVKVHFKREAILFSVLARTLALEDHHLAGVDREHNALTARASRMREALRGEQGCPSGLPDVQIHRLDFQKLRAASETYIALFRDHIAFEEKRLLPLAAIRLTEPQKRRIWHV